MPECRIPFDRHGGEPRNADLAALGTIDGRCVAVTVEAKADEPFGDTVGNTLVTALNRFDENPRSRGIDRIQGLVTSLFGRRQPSQKRVADLRYQLLTAVAGSVAYAIANRAELAVLVIHEFKTDKTSDRRHANNEADYRNLLTRMSAEPAIPEGLIGPFSIPGMPLFSDPPPLLIGKISTNRRGVGV
jgi:hypothetical protein